MQWAASKTSQPQTQLHAPTSAQYASRQLARRAPFLAAQLQASLPLLHGVRIHARMCAHACAPQLTNAGKCCLVPAPASLSRAVPRAGLRQHNSRRVLKHHDTISIGGGLSDRELKRAQPSNGSMRRIGHASITKVPPHTQPYMRARRTIPEHCMCACMRAAPCHTHTSGTRARAQPAKGAPTMRARLSSSRHSGVTDHQTQPAAQR